MADAKSLHQRLAAEFPRDAVHWRAQTLTRDGDKALALAYLDARDVMDRLDEVCGPENWQSENAETPRGRVICRLGIFVNDRWVWKSDGAGDTAVEGEKGGISDALKRAAVHWGVGRYLYRMPSVWVPCETYTNKAGKKVWKAWRVDPWTCVRGSKKPDEPKEKTPAEKRDFIKNIIEGKTSSSELDEYWNNEKLKGVVASLPEPMQFELQRAYTDRMGLLTGPTADELMGAG